MERGRGGLPGGPVNVLTVYPQHSEVVAAACHSQKLSRGPFTSVSLLLSLSWFVFLSFISLHPHTGFFLAYSSHKSSLLSLLLPSLLSFKKRQLERESEKMSSWYAVCLIPHPDLLLCFRVPEKAKISNIRCHHLSPEIVSLSLF